MEMPTISRPLEPYFFESSTRNGISARQGPHQVAQKLTSRGFPLKSDSRTVRPSNDFSAKSGAGIPAAARRAAADGEAAGASSAVNSARPPRASTAAFMRAAPPRALQCSASDPFRAVDLDEVLDSFAPGETHPDRTAFALESHGDVEERPACAFLRRPCVCELHRRSVSGELEFVAVGQLSHGLLELLEHRCELIEMPLSLCVGKRHPIACKRRLLRRRGRLRRR